MKIKILNKIKKGELTSTQLISIILIVVGLVIISFFIYQLNWTGNVDREVCHQSVIIRGTLPDKWWLDTKDYSPLTCKTKKMCFSDNLIQKGSCSNPNLGDKFDTIRIGSNLETQDNSIKTTIAREMADCWSMMGEGKLQVFKRDLASLTNRQRCVVCSIIDFQDSVKTKNTEVDGMGLYLMSHLVPNTDKAYWAYLTRSNSVGVPFLCEGEKCTSGQQELKNFDKMNTANPKAVIYLEKSRSYLGGWLGFTGGGVLGGTVLGFLTGGPIGAGIGFVVGGSIAAKAGDDIQKQIDFNTPSVSGIFLIDYNSDDFKNLKCDSLENIP